MQVTDVIADGMIYTEYVLDVLSLRVCAVFSLSPAVCGVVHIKMILDTSTHLHPAQPVSVLMLKSIETSAAVFT